MRLRITRNHSREHIRHSCQRPDARLPAHRLQKSDRGSAGAPRSSARSSICEERSVRVWAGLPLTAARRYLGTLGDGAAATALGDGAAATALGDGAAAAATALGDCAAAAATALRSRCSDGAAATALGDCAAATALGDGAAATALRARCSDGGAATALGDCAAATALR
jgi:hypothetical protein